MLSTKRVILIVALLCGAAMLKNIRFLSIAHEVQPSQSVDSLSEIRKKDTNFILPGPPPDNNTFPVNQLIHLAIYGIGHRLIRVATAWHLSKSLNLTRIKFLWGTCGEDHTKGPKIFPHLFGDETFSVPSSNNLPAYGKELLIKNDVYGYVPGQAFKDHHLPLASHYKDADGPFLEKLSSDLEIYKLLRDRYVFKDQVKGFMEDHKFKEHTVLGIHLRLGNGEETHFKESGRGILNETEFVTTLAKLIQDFIGNIQLIHPPLIFLATDTNSLVSQFVNATRAFGVSTVVLPQIRVKDDEGVTFKALRGAGRKCLEGWQAMFSDMLLLSHSDVLIATRHSSFTQSLPLSLVFDHSKDERSSYFCEVSNTSESMTCFENMRTWLFRDNEEQMTTYSLGEHVEQNVVHKLLVHLPDIEPAREFAHGVSFLNEKVNDPAKGTLTHTYGEKRFNPKYRLRKISHLMPSWNFTG